MRIRVKITVQKEAPRLASSVCSHLGSWFHVEVCFEAVLVIISVLLVVCLPYKTP